MSFNKCGCNKHLSFIGIFIFQHQNQHNQLLDNYSGHHLRWIKKVFQNFAKRRMGFSTNLMQGFDSLPMLTTVQIPTECTVPFSSHLCWLFLCVPLLPLHLSLQSFPGPLFRMTRASGRMLDRISDIIVTTALPVQQQGQGLPCTVCAMCVCVCERLLGEKHSNVLCVARQVQKASKFQENVVN